jgi:hypothetical protein
MLRTVEAVIEEDPAVGPIDFDDEPEANETAILSEPALSDWNRPEEDEAWAYLQQAP